MEHSALGHQIGSLEPVLLTMHLFLLVARLEHFLLEPHWLHLQHLCVHVLRRVELAGRVRHSPDWVQHAIPRCHGSTKPNTGH